MFNDEEVAVCDKIPTIAELIEKEIEQQEGESHYGQINQIYVDYLNFLKMSQLINICEK
jgi:hypothetical protein